MQHKTRGEVWFRERGRCLRDAQGKLLYVTGAVREISEHPWKLVTGQGKGKPDGDVE